MVPWATLALVALNGILFMYPIRSPWGACLSVRTVWDRGQWDRVLLAPFHHLSVYHLLMNMSTLLLLGKMLEEQVGSMKTGGMLLSLALLGGILHLLLNILLEAITGHLWYRQQCAVGFSGVLFSLEAMGRNVKPITIIPLASGGIVISIRWWCILECLLVAYIHPSSSFTGHIAGILSGLVLSSASTILHF